MTSSSRGQGGIVWRKSFSLCVASRSALLGSEKENKKTPGDRRISAEGERARTIRSDAKARQVEPQLDSPQTSAHIQRPFLDHDSHVTFYVCEVFIKHLNLKFDHFRFQNVILSFYMSRRRPRRQFSFLGTSNQADFMTEYFGRQSTRRLFGKLFKGAVSFLVKEILLTPCFPWENNENFH